MSGNDVTLVGNLARDPELRFTASGLAVCNFGIAVNRKYTDPGTGKTTDTVSFFEVVCWRELAENVAETLGKGSGAIVAGRLEQRSWETQEGEKRYKVEVVAEAVGPNLRWATATVEKNQPSGGYVRDAPPGYGEDAAPSQYDEEPF